MADFGTIARPYARAIFDIALAADSLEVWSSGLAAAGAVAEDKSAREFLSRPELGTAETSEFMGSVLASIGDAAIFGSQEGRNLLKLLAENDRLGALAEISAQFDQLKAEQENRVAVTLVSASAVDAAQAEKISGALSRKLGRSVDLTLEIDASLLGGAIIRAKDMVIDDSLQTRLKRLASTLAD
jgi:F-type H+-transporting ATPase subunit delta